LPGSFDDTLNFGDFDVMTASNANAVNGNVNANRGSYGDNNYNGYGSNHYNGYNNNQKLLDRISELENTLTKQSMVHAESMSSLERKHAELHDRNTTDALQRDRELLLMQQRLIDRKETFRDLAISEALFNELDELPESQLTLKEFVCVAVYRGLARAKKDLSEATSKNVELRDKLESVCDSHEVNVRELSRAKKIAENNEKSLREDLKCSDDKLEVVEAKVREFQRTVSDLREKGRKYDELFNRAKAAEEKYEELRKMAENQAMALNNAADTEKKVVQKSLDDERQLQLLTMDKSFLQKELELICQKAERSERDNMRNQELLRDAVVKRDELVMQLAEARHEGKNVYEEKLEKELNRIRENSSKELEDIRHNSNEVWERENRMLKDAKLDAMKDAERLHRDLMELRNTYDGLVLSHASERSELEGHVMEMRGEVKMKNFELAKMSTGYEEAKLKVKESELQIEHLRQQLIVHQTEFIKLRQESASDVEILEGKLRAKDEQLEIYLQAEIQFEATIEEGQDPGAVAALSAPRRRVLHAVTLARRCVEIEKTRVELSEKVEALTAEKGELLSKCTSLEQQIEQVQQPTKYMLDGFIEKEKRINELATANEDLELEVTTLREELDKVISRRETLGAAVEILNEFGGSGGEDGGDMVHVQQMMYGQGPPAAAAMTPVAAKAGKMEVDIDEEEAEEDDDDDDDADLSLHMSRTATPSKAYHSATKK
jgi:chromosome segregation ATPase